MFHNTGGGGGGVKISWKEEKREREPKKVTVEEFLYFLLRSMSAHSIQSCLLLSNWNWRYFDKEYTAIYRYFS